MEKSALDSPLAARFPLAMAAELSSTSRGESEGRRPVQNLGVSTIEIKVTDNTLLRLSQTVLEYFASMNEPMVCSSRCCENSMRSLAYMQKLA